MSSQRINDRIAEAELVFAVDRTGGIRQLKNRFTAAAVRELIDLQVMVEQIENLKLAACGSAMRYKEDGHGEMVTLKDGEWDQTTGQFYDLADAWGRIDDGSDDATVLASHGPTIPLFDSGNPRLAEEVSELFGGPPPTLGSDGRTIGYTIGGLALVALVALGREQVEDLGQPGFGERGEYGDTGVVNTGEPFRDAAHDLESRGIDATANPDLVEAWAHALEVADATD